jgi:hypothetical protein
MLRKLSRYHLHYLAAVPLTFLDDSFRCSVYGKSACHEVQYLAAAQDAGHG